jgi:methionyl aminopeptidase
MIHIKKPHEVIVMQEGGAKLKRVVEQVAAAARPGVTPKELDRLADELIQQEGAEPSFKRVPGYTWATCMCINDIVVHGIPDTTPLQEGDIAGIDIGVYYKGFNTDSSWSVVIGDNKKHDRERAFLQAGEQVLEDAIAQVQIGNRIGHISRVIQKGIKQAGYSVVRELVGHGVGKKLHEDPEVPGLLRGSLSDTSEIVEGMALAVEVIYTMGKPDIYLDQDGWTIRTKDGTLSGLFEKTVIASNRGVLVLT